MTKKKENALVISQEMLAPDIYSMWLQTEAASEAKPGQFISMYTNDGSKLLPRPISICEIDKAAGRLRVVYRVTGKDTGTEQFSKMSAGDTVPVIGPLGNGFPYEKAEGKKVFLMGGGIGVPPILELAKQMKCEKKQILAGYRDAQTFLREEFEQNGELYISTEDGSVGTKGNVMDAIRENGLTADMIFACGPTPMLRAIKAYAEENGIECYISLEERMACGIGACLACVCKSKEKDHHSNVNNKRICKDGPVFLTGIPFYGGGDLMDMRVNIAGVEWKNPVTVASGTFGSGAEFADYVDLNRLGAVTTKGVANIPWAGAVTTKGVANIPWAGNPTPRVAETYGGMMNAVGLQNPGIDVFCERDIPFLRQYDTKIIVNVCGKSTEDYCEVVERLADEDVDMLEINISCPNVKEGGIAFGQNPKAAEDITKAVKKYAKQPVIMKLSPNVTSIAEMAKAVEAGGADAVSLINTITGMKIDINRKSFVLANKTGGVSGPAIHPIAVRMVYEASNAVKVPVIGMGGIAKAEDAIEMILAGASAVSVGTANFHDPGVTMKIVDGIEEYMKRQGFETVAEMVGIVK